MSKGKGKDEGKKGDRYFTMYVDDRDVFTAKVDTIGWERGCIAREGRAAGQPNRSAVIVALVDEELARVASEQIQRGESVLHQGVPRKVRW